MNLKEWLQKIREYSDDNVKIALIANKKDLVEDYSASMKKMFAQYIEDNFENSKDSVVGNAKFKIETL